MNLLKMKLPNSYNPNSFIETPVALSGGTHPPGLTIPADLPKTLRLPLIPLSP